MIPSGLSKPDQVHWLGLSIIGNCDGFYDRCRNKIADIYRQHFRLHLLDKIMHFDLHFTEFYSQGSNRSQISTDWDNVDKPDKP